MTPTIENAEGAQGIPTLALGAEGLFLVVLAVILAVEIYRWVTQQGWTIKMPDSVPSNVSASFSSLIPVLFVLVIFTLIRIYLVLHHMIPLKTLFMVFYKLH